LEKLPGIISVGILAIIVILMACFYQRMIRSGRFFILYTALLFCYEFTLLITSTLHIGNHLIANINTLIYSCLVLALVIDIYRKYNPKLTSVRMLLMSVCMALLVGWIVDNFAFGNTILVYNSVLSGVVSIVIALICIYLLNVLILTKSGDILKDPDVLIIAGILTRSLTFGFSLWFLNFDYGFDWNFLSNLLTGINVGLCLSDLFFLMATMRLITLGRKVVRVSK
jgi:hypothetical protein